MIFTDPAFLFVFLPVFCATFFFVGHRFGNQGAIAFLFLASLVCYAPWGAGALILLLCSIFINFATGVALAHGNSPLGEVGKRRLYALGQTINFAVLIWFKYQVIQYFLSTVGHRSDSFIMAMIPAGISFYTFHQAAFLADARKRDHKVVQLVERASSVSTALLAFTRYGAFVSFFPQLIIGPITYMKEFSPQVDRKEFGRFRSIDFSIGLTLIACGLFKKLVLADNLATISAFAFQFSADHRPMAVSTAVAGVLGYYAQLYFDFSGYSDMALGLARMVGLRYPINFFSPLKAVGIIDFYRRWHMTLTRVISRFVFTPLSVSGTRKSMRLPKRWRKLISLWLPLLLNFELIALWHGATATFIVFGAIHGLWYITETEVRNSKWFKAWRKRSSDSVRSVIGRLVFAGPMMLTFALFRSESLSAFYRLCSSLAGMGRSGWHDGTVSVVGFAMLGVSFMIIGLLPNATELLRNYRPGIFTYVNPVSRVALRLPAWRPTWPWAIGTGLVALWSLYFISRQPPFLYQGF